MQSVSGNLQAELNKGASDPRVLVDLYELYPADYVPVAVSTTAGTSGFDPASAVQKFAAQTITWNGIAYMREVIGRGDVVRNMGEKTNSVSLNFSNISRYLATWAQTQDIEGLFLVIRTVCPTVTDDSIVLFVGRCDKPSDIDKKEFSLSARQDFGNINQELPPRRFTAEDPEGRTSSDPLYEGFKLLSTSGSFSIPVTTPSTSFFGRLFGKSNTKNENRPFSSMNTTPFGQVVPMIFGRTQLELIPIYFVDEGYNLGGFWVVGEGRVDDYIVTVHNNYLQQTQVDHYGDPGGTGSNADLQPRLGTYLSNTAYTARSMYGSPGDEAPEEPPLVTALIRGLRIPVPNSSGVFDSEAWTDNPVYILRFVLTDPRLVNIDPGFMEDAVNYATGLHCDEPLIDYTNSQIIAVPNPDLVVAGTAFTRFRATGEINPRAMLRTFFGMTSIIPELEDGPYEGFDPLDPPDVFTSQPILRKRYTANVPITDSMRAVDFAYKVLNPCAKLYIRINKRGKYEIRSEKPSDQTYVRTATAVGATTIPVLDVTPWKSGDLLTGRLLTGFNLITAEVRNVTTAVYSSDGNAIALAAGATGGGATATASGATLTGGSTTVQASGTVTIGGTPAAGNLITATINGVAVSYTLTADDTTGTAAAMLANYINATGRLRPYIRATWVVGSPTVVTIKCLYGVLTVDSQLLKVHTGPIADPTTAPTVAASSGGSLPAGTYKVAYSNVGSVGQTALTALASIVVTANQKIDISGLPAFPAGITSRNFYLSDQADSVNLKLSVNRTNTSNFSITTVPDGSASLPPSFNNTAEELLRVAMSFATNSQDVYPVWPASTLLVLNDIYLPTTPNGHKYQVTTAGTTGASEPTWPTTAGGTVVNGGVTFTEIGSTVLQQAGLTRANIKKDSFKWPLGSRQSSVNQSKGSYIDATNDFAKTPIRVNDRAHQTQVKKIYPHEIDLSAVDNLHQALRLLNWDLAKNREGDWFNALGAGPSALVLEEGDVICSSDDSGGLINVATRVEDLRIHPNHDVTINQARKYSTTMFSDDVGAQPIVLPSTLRLTTIADSVAHFIDNFPIRDEDGSIVGFYIAVSRDLDIEGDWRGWALYADYGDGYVQIASGDIAAFVGTSTTTLATVSDSSVFDRVNTHTFTLQFGPLTPFDNPFATVTEAQLLSNPLRNLFLIGNEYVQAASITDNGNRSYTLGTLLRGRFGTNTTELTHSASERVVFLNGAEVVVPIDPVRLNTAYNYKVVTTNQDVADAAVVPFTWTGGTAKPLPPSSLRRELDSANNTLLMWNRRTRIGAGMRPYSDVPIGEEEERYEIAIYKGSTIKRLMKPVFTGMGLAALFESDGGSKFTSISVNTITQASTGAVRGRSLQEITETNNFVEATLIQPGASGQVGIGLIGSSKLWKGLNAITSSDYHASIIESGGSFFLRFYVGGVQVYSETAVGYTTGIRVRISLSGSEVRFTKNWVGPGTPAQYVSAVAPSYPLRVLGEAVSSIGSTFVVQKAVMTMQAQPGTIYTAAQATVDGILAGGLVTVRAYQISAILGRGGYAEKTFGTFTPLEVANLKLWLDAESLGLADGTSVSSFTDLSGNANHATQATGANQPVLKTSIINGKAVVRFDQTNDAMDTPNFSLTQPYTVFVVAKYNQAFLNNDTIYDGLVLNTSRFYRATSTRVDMYAGLGGPQANTTPESFHLHEHVFNGASSTMRIDGGTPTTGNPSTGVPGGIRLNSAAGSNFGGQDFAAMVVYQGLLSSTDRQAVEDYLRARFGV